MSMWLNSGREGADDMVAIPKTPTVLLEFMIFFHTQQNRLDGLFSISTAITYFDVKVVPTSWWFSSVLQT